MAEPGPRLPRAPGSPATLGIFALSGRVEAAQLDAGVRRLEAAGHRVIVAPECLHEWRYFAGTDRERLAGFHRLLDDPDVEVMMAARGGYGLTRVLAGIDWARVGASGKTFVGFSDFTAFNGAALALGGIATLHGPMAASDFGGDEPDPFMRGHFEATLYGAADSETVACDHRFAPGSVRGTLWGGNLASLAHLVGTPFLPAIDGGLLYVEDIAEDPYAVERMFLQLHHAGVLPRQRAVLLGSFRDCVPNNPARYPYSMSEVIETLRSIVAGPVVTDLPFGHVARKLTLPFGLEAELALGSGEYTLRWPGLGGR